MCVCVCVCVCVRVCMYVCVSVRADPLSYFSFQPVLHDWCNKGRGM